MKKKKNKNILLPKRTKFKRVKKGHLSSIERKLTATRLHYGTYGLKVLKASRLDSTQIEAARRQISRALGKYEFLWIRVIPDIPVTKKPQEIRMGKGKGAVDHWVTKVKAGQTIFELTQMLPQKAQIILLSAAKKLAVPCAIIFNLQKI